jgi:hypothetical protein
MERFISQEDKQNIESYKEKCKQVKDYAISCLMGTHTGLLLFGSGGNGKSYSIRETFTEKGITEVEPDTTPDLEEQRKMYVVHQGRITPKGLVQEMERFPYAIHLIEDAETMFDDKNCWGVLRMALHSQDHSRYPARRVTWKTSVDVIDFYFRGSLILVGNRLLDSSLEEVKAVETRSPCVMFDITNPEMISQMKQICERGYKAIPGAELSKEDCYNVLAFILDTRKNNPKITDSKLNFRVLISGFRFMALSKLEKSIDWHTMIQGQLEKEVTSKRGRAERVYDEAKVAKELSAMKFKTQHEKLVEYCKRVGRPIDWAGLIDSDPAAYKKGFDAAKQDFKRKSK